jgi:hypothetical protein
MTGMFFSARNCCTTSDVWPHHDAEISLLAICRAFSSSLHRASIPVITQPPYSSDLASSDFWLFPTLKMSLKGTRFATMEDIKSNVKAELQKIPKEAFFWCFQQWQDRWSKCVYALGSYFEGD